MPITSPDQIEDRLIGEFDGWVAWSHKGRRGSSAGRPVAVKAAELELNFSLRDVSGRGERGRTT